MSTDAAPADAVIAPATVSENPTAPASPSDSSATGDEPKPRASADADADKDKDKDKEKDKRRKKRSKEKGASKRAAPDAGSAAVDGGGGSTGAAAVEPKTENAPLPPSDGTAAPLGATPADSSAKETSADCALPEKDMAREASRRNSPTICSIDATKKAFILIPLKGSIEGEHHKLHGNPVREARVTLPAGSEALLTMKQYKVKRLGFKELRVNPTEGGGTRLRVKLQPGAGDPVVDVKNGYAKITVATPDTH
ncbi:MAG: hypothetical protein ABUS79_01240 [Pseudomonadota bacterium]